MNWPLIMGVLNVTPDSFSDGGLWTDHRAALEHARQMWAEGASIIDIGGESTRPGAGRVTPDEEWARIGALVPVLLGEGMTVSVDTVHSATARLALAAGVQVVNDVSGGRHDPEMAYVVADSDARFVVQHWRGFPADPFVNEEYSDVVTDALRETEDQAVAAIDCGVRREQIIIDPGLGFAKRAADCWRIIDNLETWVHSGYPVLVGASRKRFLRECFGDRIDEATLEVTKRCAQAKVWAVRVHDVGANVRAVQ